MLAFLAGPWCAVLAQSASPSAVTGVGATPTSLPPFIAPENALDDAALVDALRKGGYILYMRHAHAGLPTAVCPGESTLTPDGEMQARRVGAALRELRIPIAAIRSSQTCRTRQTATLLELGEVTSDAELNPAVMRKPVADYAKQFSYLFDKPPAGANLLLVSHVQGSSKPQERIMIELAEIAVYRLDGSGSPVVVARIAPNAWDRLIAVAPR